MLDSACVRTFGDKAEVVRLLAWNKVLAFPVLELFAADSSTATMTTGKWSYFNVFELMLITEQLTDLHSTLYVAFSSKGAQSADMIRLEAKKH